MSAVEPVKPLEQAPLSTKISERSNLSSRKKSIFLNSENLAPRRETYRQRAAFFHEEDLRYLRFLIPPGLRVLEVGCGTGAVLAGLEPSFGVGVDISPAMIREAKRLRPGLQFLVGDAEDAEFIASLPGPFDAILIVDTIGSFDDCQRVFEALSPPLPSRNPPNRCILFPPLGAFSVLCGIDWMAKQAAVTKRFVVTRRQRHRRVGGL